MGEMRVRRKTERRGRRVGEEERRENQWKGRNEEGKRERRGKRRRREREGGR